jgi:exopolysaccharide/PEP-CTERM locus tyrosine autokinase
MSVLERAIEKLQRRGAPAGRTEPIARVTPTRSDDLSDGSSVVQPAGRRLDLDLNVLRGAGLYSDGDEQLADEYRAIKQPILRKAAARDVPGDPRNNLVLVTSSLAGEGKTFTTLNLSLSLASEKDWHVLLIDVDCKNPQLTRLLGSTDQPGLLDWLAQPGGDVRSLIMSTNVEGLSVLPLGRKRANAAELLGSSQMNAFCEQLAAATRQLVLFDSAPMLLTVESAVLARHVGQIVVVVDAYRVPQQAVMKTIEKLDPTKAIGLVLNRAEQFGESMTYGYGYGYGSSKDDAPATAERER